MTISESDIAGIVERVVSRVQGELSGRPQTAAPTRGPTIMTRGAQSDHGVFGSIGEAIAAAEKAFVQLGAVSLETRAKMIEAMRKAADAANRELAEFAVRETGLGRVEDKLKKNANA